MLLWLLAVVVCIPLGLRVIGKLMMTWRARHLSTPLQFTGEESAQIQRNYGADKNVLVIVNPFGGNGFGTLVYDRLVAPTLTRLGVKYTTLRTDRSKHALEHLTSCSSFAAVFVIGGDGMVHEVLNGVMNRSDGDFIPIAHIPAGTGNGIATSLTLTALPHIALKRILLANPAGQPIDLVEVTQQSGGPTAKNGQAHREYSVMSFNFGLVGDADNMLENKSRWMGWLRDIVVPMWFIAKATMYRGRIEFTPAPVHDTESELGRAISQVRDLPRNDKGQCVIEGDIHFFIGSSITHIAHDVHCLPFAQPNDGCLDVLVYQRSNRLTDLSFFIDASTCINVPKFLSIGGYYLKMHEATITPIDPPVGSPHIVISTDGEVLPTLPTTIRMLNNRGRFIF